MSDFYKRLISSIAGILLSADSLWLLLQDKIHLGILLPLLIGVLLIIYALFFSYFQQWHQHSRFRSSV